MTTKRTKNAAARAAHQADVRQQDACARGAHVWDRTSYLPEYQGARACRCGAVEPAFLANRIAQEKERVARAAKAPVVHLARTMGGPVRCNARRATSTTDPRKVTCKRCQGSPFDTLVLSTLSQARGFFRTTGMAARTLVAVIEYRAEPFVQRAGLYQRTTRALSRLEKDGLVERNGLAWRLVKR